MRARIRVLALVLAASTFVASPALAKHYCSSTAGTVVPIETPAAIFYVHDRCGSGTDQWLPHYVLCDDGEGTWIFKENGLAEGLQIGGEAIVELMNYTGSDDPCPRDPNADDVVF